MAITVERNPHHARLSPHAAARAAKIFGISSISFHTPSTTFTVLSKALSAGFSAAARIVAASALTAAATAGAAATGKKDISLLAETRLRFYLLRSVKVTIKG